MRRFVRFLTWWQGLRRSGGSRAFGASRNARRSGRFGRSGQFGLAQLLRAFGAFWQGRFTRKPRTGRGPALTRPRPRPAPRRIDERASRRAFGTICAFLALSFVLWALFAPGGGLVTYFRAKGDLAEMRQKSADLTRENAELRDEIDRLKTDEAYLEKVARGKYGLLKKDERVYNFTPKNKKDR